MKPILLNIPNQIETKRLILRPPLPGDGEELNSAILESFETLKEWIPWATQKPTVEESEENARRAFAQWILREDMRFSIFLKSTKKFVASTGLHRIEWKIPKFEIGYWCRTSCEGKGYTTEAVAALTQFVFKELKAKRVEICCDTKNKRSMKLPSRLGFTLEGIKRNSYTAPHDNSLRDGAVYVRFDAKGLPSIRAKWKFS